MNVEKIRWTINVIEKLQRLEIGNSRRLNSIKKELERGSQISENEIIYLKQKYQILQQLERSTFSKRRSGKPIFETLNLIKTSCLSSKLGLFYFVAIIILMFPVLMTPYDIYMGRYLSMGFSFVNFTNEELEAAKWIEKNTPDNSLIYSDPFSVLEFRGLTDRKNIEGIGVNQAIVNQVISELTSTDAADTYNKIMSNQGATSLIVITPRTSVWLKDPSLEQFPIEKFENFAGFNKFFDTRYFTLVYQSKNIFIFELKSAQNS